MDLGILRADPFKVKATYSKINIKVFLEMEGQVPFNVFIQMNDNKYMKVFNNGDAVDLERFWSYQAKGVSTLYIPQTERREYIGTIERQIYRSINELSLKSPQTLALVEELTEQTLYEIYEDGIFDQSSVRRCTSIIKTYIALLETDVKLLTNFIALSRNETYWCRHHIATAVIAILLSKASGHANPKTLLLVGLGALLHDVGLLKVPKEFWEAEYRLRITGGEQIKKHPSLGAQLIKSQVSTPSELSLVIEQHHEHHDGSGYPHGLSRDEIFYPARVVALADAFSSLTTRRENRATYRPDEALEILAIRHGEFDPKLFETFEKLIIPGRKASAAS